MLRAFRGRQHLLAAVVVLLAAGCSNPTAADAPALGPLPTAPAMSDPVAALAPSSLGASQPASHLAQVRQLLIQSASRHGVNPYLVMAVAWWESGWDQGQVSATGAVGIMQVEPATAAAAGPNLLHRNADIHDPADNIELGVAVLKEDLDNFHGDMAKALIAYYAGPAAVTDWNDEDAGAKRYVLGVYRLAEAFSRGEGPA